MDSRPFEELHCQGSHYEMGQVQGVWLKPRFEELYGSLLSNPLTPGWVRMIGPHLFKVLLTVKGVSIQHHHMPHMQAAAPCQVDRMRGMAAGADLRLPLLLGIGCIETMAAHFQYVMGCSSLGVGVTRSKLGEPMLYYNHDFPSFLRPQLMIRHSQPDEAHRSVQLTYPTLAGCIAGVNSCGVALSLNHAFSTESFNHGTPPTLVMQEALDLCKTADEVVNLFGQATFSCGSMATVIDEQGVHYAMELSRERFAVREPHEDLSLTLNNYQHESLQEIEVPQNAQFDPKKFPEIFHGEYVHRSNWERRERFEALLQQFDSLAEQDLEAIFSDHAGEEEGGIGTICRHHPTSDTIATVMLYPKRRLMKAARGFPCQADHQDYQVNADPS